MAKKFVRGVTGIEDIKSYDKTLTNVNDILSDGQDTYVHTKKGKNESYYKLTDGVKQVKSTDSMLTISKDSDGTVSISNNGLATKEELNKWIVPDGSVGWKQRTPIGSQSQVQYFGTGKINFDFKNKLIVIPKDTNIVVGRMNIKIGADITTSIPTSVNFFILTTSLKGTSFNCYTNENINNMSESEVVIAVCNNAKQAVEINGDYLMLQI